MFQSPVGTAPIDNDMLVALALQGMSDRANAQFDPADRIKHRGYDRNLNWFAHKMISKFAKILTIVLLPVWTPGLF
jgi:hypothetical protein